jgi:LPXTG-site transpeptidase (sortase) family protein
VSGQAAAPGPEPVETLSPLAEQLGPRLSARPEIVAPRPRPIGLQMQSIDVGRFPIRPVGLELDGQMEIPDETEIGWYRYGATAGQPGATVLAAHVSWNRTNGPFARLGAVEPGEQIEVALDDGTVRRYEVTERAVYGKLELPRERIWRNTGDETLVLITCGGDYNPEIRRYRENIVVYAVPVG